MAIAEPESKVVPPEEFLQELEGLREQHLKGGVLRPPRHYSSTEEVAAAKRRAHIGANGANHKFEGERYLNCTEKSVRRFQLRKLIDEGGQQTVGVGLPSHPELARWESREFGLTDEEIDRLEKDDMLPDVIVWQGWRSSFHRTAHWAVGIGSSLVGEGEKRIPAIRQKILDEIEERRKQYTEWGIEDVERALANAIEHAGVDVEHSEFGARVVREYVNTPELQDQLREGFILTLHHNGY